MIAVRRSGLATACSVVIPSLSSVAVKAVSDGAMRMGVEPSGISERRERKSGII